MTIPRIDEEPDLASFLAQIRFGRFEDILEDMKTRRRPARCRAPYGSLLRATRTLRAGNPPEAAKGASRARAGGCGEHVDGSPSVRIPRRNSSACLPASSKEESLLVTKSQAAALAAFQRAVSVEDSLVWDEPEPLPFSARHWLGAALLEIGRPAEAEPVYRAISRSTRTMAGPSWGSRKRSRRRGNRRAR